ncbi:CBS domain-containing protein [Rhizobium mesoamericanum]|uniref:CBS domain-containing protein n=1 Tax=Rhizobium mesoamericanum TaxID=1079800 RepID=UPI00278B878A|nr:CBS domain-containing protein [Rhizobium mesoamericanum]MDQ0563548.1 CBS domain-containing protein [Rhizobium mesoamericanum]
MLVESAMTPSPITVCSSSTIFEAADIMLANRISGLPVVDDKGVLVGIITEGDFLRRHELDTNQRRSWLQSWLASPGKIADEYVRAHGRRVEEVMNTQVVAVGLKAPLSDAVRLMERHDIKRLPVISDGRLVGIISRSDLLRALMKIEKLPAPSTEDAQIQSAVEAELAKQSWSRNGFIRCQVRNGVAELVGTIFDERERRAAKVATENVPGVKAIADNLTWIDPYYGVALPPPVEEELASRS